MHYLVTGGAGFIGSHLVEALLGRGDQVRIIDNFSTGKRENISQHKNIELVEASITDHDAITSAFQNIDGVFHLAALPQVQFSIEQPRESHEVNINGTLNVILAARDAGVKRLVYSASSAAYGDQPLLPLHEEMKPNPMSPYGLQKYVGEEKCKIASLVWGLETVSLRYFNVYGPRLSFTGAYANVIGVFLKQRAASQSLTITGDGEQTRDFIYVDDVVTANISAMERRGVGRGEVMNIGSGAEKSVKEIARLIGGETLTVSSRIEPKATRADIKKARELLGWQPMVCFEDGLRNTIQWFNKSAN